MFVPWAVEPAERNPTAQTACRGYCWEIRLPSLWEIHAPQKVLEAGVRPKAIKVGINFKKNNSELALLVSFFQIGECAVFFSQRRIDLRRNVWRNG